MGKKQTVEYIASLESLDQPLTVVSIKGWLFLLFSIVLCLCVILWAFVGTIPITVSGKSILLDLPHIYTINSTTTGMIKEIKVQAGDAVTKGQILMSISGSVQQEEVITAPSDGVINVIKVIQGEEVSENAFLISMQGPANPATLKIYGFVPFTAGSSITPGMGVKCALNTVNTSVYGMLLGTVKEVVQYPISLSDAQMKQIPSESLRQYLISGNTLAQLVIIDPVLDSHTVSGLAWTSQEGPPTHVESGNIGAILITINKVRPISYVIPSIRKK